MIIIISGLHGTGKSTVGNILAKKLNLKYYSTGQAFRELAKEKVMSLKEFNKFVEEHSEIDKTLDNKVLQKAQQEDNIVIDSQIGGYLLKDLADHKILLKCPLEIRVKRMVERDDSLYHEKLEETKVREQSEMDRFKDLYDIDLSDENKQQELYDIIIDTSNLSIEEVVEKILSKINLK
ncbi:MAG: AAA family ATPase [Candidatus Lokiarchaeota archaeon]